MRTPEQAQLLRWVEKRYDIDEIERAELITRNAMRLCLRSGEDYILICRQSGRIEKLPTEELWPAAV
ncbi:hypothetical protein I4200191B4_18310 [Pseudoflavonifractor gallinarum]|uniref:hypothetical protein n=1 Tax=Pseudoflavonifractor gallinarum TaxID=2779352 RepID=UPI0036F2E52D